MKYPQGYTIRAVQEETRRGPWTEQEDLQLVLFVGYYGERRWDFIAKVSGLNRTGKSCRLRWVNYLRPDLKRGRMTPQEEELVLKLHSRWGNRWSKIARKLPGRTDNEIKNYWRTHMRKEAQERKQTLSISSSSSCNQTSSPPQENSENSNSANNYISYDATSGVISREIDDENGVEDGKGSLMEQIWNEIAASDMLNGPNYENFKVEDCDISGHAMPSPLWDYCPDSLWRMNEEELDPFVSHFKHGRYS